MNKQMKITEVQKARREFGRALFECRADMGLTVDEVCRQVGLNALTLQRLELGQISLNNIWGFKRLAHFYDKRLKICLEERHG